MVLTLDIGNTRIKAAVFEEDRMLDFFVIEIENSVFEVKKILKNFKKITHSISSVVGKEQSELFLMLKNETVFIQIQHDFKFPFHNKYATPSTLGIDRAVLVSGASLCFPKKHTLIIDAGSCITYDYINEKNEYLGGAISPGLNMRYKALNTFTAKLPFLEKQESSNFIGNSTINSIHSGVLNGILYEIDGFIAQYKAENKDLTIILTGGDADFLAKSLKNPIFAHSNFLLESLNLLYNYWKEKNE